MNKTHAVTDKDLASRLRSTTKSRFRHRAWGITGILLLLLAGGIIWWFYTPPDADTPTTPSGRVGVQIGEIAPDFTVPTLDGGTFTLAEGRGQPTIIFFMAYWCGSCLPEAQALAQIQQEHGDKVRIVTIDVDPSSNPESLSYFKELGGNGAFTWAFDSDQQVVQVYQVQALDTTLVLDAEGRIIYRDSLPTSYQTLKDVLQELEL